MRNKQTFSVRVLSMTCLGFLLAGTLAGLTGCGPGGNKEAAQKEETLQMEVVQIDQYKQLAEKRADGQYLVTRVVMKNAGNKSLTMQPAEFVLENITDKDSERYSQPAEKQMTQAFTKVYGRELKDRLMDFSPTNLYPRLQLERYFVFMVPSDADLDEYQITYKPAKVSARMVSSATLVNDHRNDSIHTE